MQPPYLVHLVDNDDPVAQLGRDVEARVFSESFGNSVDVLEKEYDSYSGGTFFAVVQESGTGDPVGAMRLIVDNPAGFKTLDDIESGPWMTQSSDVLGKVDLDPASLVDVATLSVVESSRRSGDSYGSITAVLFFALQHFMESRRVADLVAIIDDAVLEYINAVGIRLVPLAGLASMPYLGSPASTPAWGNLADMESHCHGVDPSLRDMYWDGIGLVGTVVDPMWSGQSTDG